MRKSPARGQSPSQVTLSSSCTIGCIPLQGTWMASGPFSWSRPFLLWSAAEKSTHTCKSTNLSSWFFLMTQKIWLQITQLTKIALCGHTPFVMKSELYYILYNFTGSANLPIKNYLLVKRCYELYSNSFRLVFVLLVNKIKWIMYLMSSHFMCLFHYVSTLCSFQWGFLYR